MKAKNFDKKFDNNQEDVVDDLELTSARRPNLETKRINVDCPSWIIEGLDQESAHIGVTRQSLIKMWLAERLKQEVAARKPYV